MENLERGNGKTPVEISRKKPEELEGIFGTSMQTGLKPGEVRKRLAEYGPNALSEPKRQGFLNVLVRELREPMILLLVVIAVVYSILGDPRDSVAIVVIVLLVVVIETYNVNRARRSIQSLRELTKPTALVYRESRIGKEKTQNIVPGDIVILSAGERVPADGRLIESYGLKIDESSLTGESFPVAKEADTIPESIQMADLFNMAFSGTLVIQGSGRLLVTNTGRRTEIGRISELVEEAEETETPLELSLKKLTAVLASIAVGFSVILPLVGFLQGNNLNEMILTGLSMAFATVPEELPVLISITLAIGAYSLSKHKAVVKDLRAAETLGSVNVIATDKTGTITENRMSLGHLYSDGIISEPGDSSKTDLVMSAVLATGTLMLEAKESSTFRDPMEVAVFQHSVEAGTDIEGLRDMYRPVDEFSFDNRIKLSSFLYEREDGKLELFVSGAPEVVIGRSYDYIDSSDEPIPMDPEHRENLLDVVDEISSMGERTIAVASRIVPERSEDRGLLERDLTFRGMVSFIDPPRKEVKKAILQCQEAGIRVIMLTGDHPRTARVIADQVGINQTGNVVTGSEISGMDDSELKTRIMESSVFARITSEDKFRIVELLQEMGETVAVTGDGVNDSPALQNAEIGIAMGIRGTEVAREASDMILLDDDFSTIVEAVHQGREILYTLRKSVKYEISIKLALVMILLVPLFLVIPFPFSPIQIIVMELLMDVAALGGFLSEREEAGIMLEPPREKGKSFLNRSMMSSILLASATLAIAVTGVYFYVLFTTDFLIKAQTAAFSTWIISQVFLAHNLRTEKEPVFHKGILSNRVILIWGIVVVLALVFITLFPDLQVMLHTSYLSYSDWILIVLASIASSFWMEAVKTVRYLIRGRPERRRNPQT